jgi:hypothetical protein
LLKAPSRVPRACRAATDPADRFLGIDAGVVIRFG